MLVPRKFIHRASYAAPGAVVTAAGVALAAAWGVWRQNGGDGHEPRLSDPVLWGLLAGALGLSWLISLRVRRSTGGLQSLMAWIGILTVVGLFFVSRADQSLIEELWSPTSAWSESGRLALIAALGPVPAVYAI